MYRPGVSVHRARRRSGRLDILEAGHELADGGLIDLAAHARGRECGDVHVAADHDDLVDILARVHHVERHVTRWHRRQLGQIENSFSVSVIRVAVCAEAAVGRWRLTRQWRAAAPLPGVRTECLHRALSNVVRRRLAATITLLPACGRAQSPARNLIPSTDGSVVGSDDFRISVARARTGRPVNWWTATLVAPIAFACPVVPLQQIPEPRDDGARSRLHGTSSWASQARPRLSLADPEIAK